ncbi:MAG TPA: sortase [Anaerolineales bacterium]|nr:sortase [Anaerolineales bacterium]
MNKSILALLISGGLIFSTTLAGQTVQAQGLSFPAEMNKSFIPLSIEPGGTARLTVTIYNPNAFPLIDASWIDNLSGVQPGILIASPVNVSNTCGGSVTAVPGGTTLSLSGGTVPAQTGVTPGWCTVLVDVTSTTPGNLINTIPAGALTSSGGGNTITNTTPASATLYVDIIQSPTLNKSFSPTTMLIGQTSQLRIRIRNNDLDRALTQVTLTDSLPSQLVLANPVDSSLSNCGSSASLTAVSGGSSVILSNSIIPANSTCTIRVNVTSIVSGIYTNTIPAASIQSQEGVTNSSSASANLNVQVFGLAKEFSPSSFQAGGIITLTITLLNPTSSAYTGVELSDTLPGNVLTVVPGSATTTCGGTVSTILPRTVRLTNGTVPAATSSATGTCTISVQATAPADVTSAAYTNTIPAGALVTNQGITNGLSASAQVRVYIMGAGVLADKSFSPETIVPGGNSRLRIDISAPADTNLTNFSIVDNLPPDVTISNSSPATRSNCGASSVLTAVTGATSITLTGATISAGTTCQINVYVTSRTPGVHTNTILPTDITNNENRTIPNNLTADLTVEAIRDISVRKSFTPPVVSPGGISALTITLRNTNISPLVNVSVTDPLPGTPTNGIIVAPDPNASTTCTGGIVSAMAGTQTISMTGGTVPAQVLDVPGECTIMVDVQGLGFRATLTNTISTANVSGTIQGTDTTLNPAQPASADIVIGNLSIGVVKGFDPLTTFGGSASTLSIELINPNNLQLNGIAFTDNMPAGMVIANPANPSVAGCGGTLDATPGAGSFSFSDGSLMASTSCTLTVRVTIRVNGNLTNVMEAGAVTTLSGATNPDPAEATLTNLPGASISKVFSPNPIRAGSVSLLTFTIQNTGSVLLSGMGFEDTLPGDLPVGLEIVGSPGPVNHCGGTLTAVAGTQFIELVDGSLAANAACTITVAVTGNINGSYTNTIPPENLTSNEGATNHDQAADTLVVTGDSLGEGEGGGGGDDTGGSAPPAQAVSGFLIPVTGFRPDTITKLDEFTRPIYDAVNIAIEIPVIKVNNHVLGVQIKEGGWDVSWLQDQVGWLNGTAYPTWKGNSVLTGHVIKADGKPGVFSKLKYLGIGEYIFIYNAGYRYTYKVVSNQYVEPGDITVFQHEDQAYLTLITCDTYDEKSNSYLQRVAVRAKLVDVRSIR